MLSALYNRTVRLERVALAASAASAAAIETWSIVQDVRCTIQPDTSAEEFEFGKTTANVTHNLYCDYGTDVRPRDRFIDGAAMYRVLGVENDGGRMHHLKVRLTQRDER